LSPLFGPRLASAKGKIPGIVHQWSHSPVHKLGPAGAYMVTGGTYLKERFFSSPERLALLHDTLLELAHQYQWDLQAWAVLSNHYHFIAFAPEESKTLVRFISHLHASTAREVNRLDSAPGRKVWFQYWDSHITFDKSYCARLAYVHGNAVHHGLVAEATAYSYCSAAWFESNAHPSFYRRVLSHRTDHLNVRDDY
jgi:putative transposase